MSWKRKDTDEAKARIENIDELLTKVVTYEQSEENPTLSGFLEEVALVADIDSLDEDSDYVVLMTLHSAKRPGISTGLPCRYGRWAVSELYVDRVRQSDRGDRGREKTVLRRDHKGKRKSGGYLCTLADDPWRNAV